MNNQTKIKVSMKRPPGTHIYSGHKPKETVITHIQYSSKEIIFHNEIEALSTDFVDWISIEGLMNVPKLKQICKDFEVDDLVLEDILNLNQRNKYEVFSDYIFIVLKYYYMHENKMCDDYISILVFKDKVITFTEGENRFQKDILDRVSSKAAPISNYKEDYLFYVVYDMIVDDSFEVLDHIKDQIFSIETEVMSLDARKQSKLYSIYKNLIILRNNVLQLQNYLLPSNLHKNNEFFSKILKKYYDDLEDHIKNLFEKSLIEIEAINKLFSLYSNNISNRMNEIMKTLTIFSAIFIPLSFLAGVFGMNFTNFPILQDQNGLYYFIGFSVLLVVGMLFYFKRRKWF